MARKKVKLAWIVNDSSRRASLKKRRLGLMKKVRELSVLCDIDACLIVYNPNDTIPVVWPTHSVVQQLVARFQSLTEFEKTRKMSKQDSYLMERVSKVEEQQSKQETRNKEVEMSDLIGQIEQNEECMNQLNLFELQQLTWFVVEKMMRIRKRMEYLEQLPFGATDHIHGKTTPPGDPLLLNQLFVDMMNKNMTKIVSNTSMMGEMDLPYVGNYTNDWNSEGRPQTEMGGQSSFGFIGPSGMALAHGNGVEPHGTELGSGSDQMRSHPFGSETMPMAGSAGLGGDGLGLPLDGKTWASNFSL